MVQLKSFKYVESSEAGEQQPASAHLADANINHNDNRRRSDQLSACSSSSSQGPNLTAPSSDSDSSQRQHQRGSHGEETTTTLSSSEEYQVAHHEIADEDEARPEGVAGAKQEPQRRQVKVVAAEAKESGVLVAQWARTPLVSRRPLVGQSPVIGRAGSASSAPTKHFEIRWHNIRLVGERSRLPKWIYEHPVYRLVRRATGAPDDSAPSSPVVGKATPALCYSPPMRRKMITISEDLESGSEGSPAMGARAPKGPQVAPATGSQASATGAPAGKRTILNNLSGSVFSGQLTAILGPSGVGKTTLLNSLTGRNTLDGSGRVSLLGGVSKRMSVVTVPQADVLPGKLSALEDLQFTSRLKNPQRGFNHERNIERVVRHLHMTKFLHTKIDRLSGGEARRLSIGRELLSSPDIMILDEPTSGLDANTCKKIISSLRDIVEHADQLLERPMSIIITIHQPQQEVLNLFHRLYVMALGGRAIYEGPPSNLMPTLLEYSALAARVPVEQLNENPAIVALEVASGEYGPALIEQLAGHHESLTLEELWLSGGSQQMSPHPTPAALRLARKSPLMGASPRSDRLAKRPPATPSQQADPQPAAVFADSGSLGRATPLIGRRAQHSASADLLSAVTSVSYASTYDADLPELTGKLKVDKRLRRSVVMKGDFVSQTLTLMQRVWLLTTRDLFLMSIRILGFLLVAAGMVQIFAGALDPNEHQCPLYESEVEDLVGYMLNTKERLMNLSHSLEQSRSTHLFFFHLVLCITMVVSALTGLVFPLQMRMFIREYKNGWYSPAAFVTSSTLAELPVDLIGPTLTLLIAYPLCHQPTSAYFWRELGYIGVLALASITCKSQAQIAGAFLMDSVENSVFMSCVLVTVPALTSGIAVRVREMPRLLQFVSYGSFLRYTVESLFLLRYGYGLCPCDPELVHGYPVAPSPDLIPPQLDNLARGILELSVPANSSSALANDTTVQGIAREALDSLQPADEHDANLFVRFLRLVSGASNQFVPKPEQLGDCNTYRSLYLFDMDIEDRILLKWSLILALMFVISRFLTYFVIKTVIKMRPQ